VATVLALIGMEFLANPAVEMAMICLSAVIGVWSLTGGYSRHKKLVPLLVFLAGFFVIASGVFLFQTAEVVVVPLGGFTLASAHYLNWKANRQCRHDVRIPPTPQT